MISYVNCVFVWSVYVCVECDIFSGLCVLCVYVYVGLCVCA